MVEYDAFEHEFVAGEYDPFDREFSENGFPNDRWEYLGKGRIYSIDGVLSAGFDHGNFYRRMKKS